MKKVDKMKSKMSDVSQILQECLDTLAVDEPLEDEIEDEDMDDENMDDDDMEDM